MKVWKKRVGDIYLNPMWGDLWILNKIWNDDEGKEVWTLNLVNDDLQEELRCVEGFIKLGNIYEICNKIVEGKEFRKKRERLTR